MTTQAHTYKQDDALKHPLYTEAQLQRAELDYLFKRQADPYRQRLADAEMRREIDRNRGN
jgi:hypothetical protein